jgi:flagellin
MALYIQTNTASLASQNNLARSQAALASSFNKLSSGYRVNTAADDAAGLAVSEKMKMQIRSMNVAERNANDGISMAQTAEGALGEITNVMGRMRELATQAANASLVTADRAYVATEFKQLQSEITRIQTSTKFNGQTMITSGAASAASFQIGADNAADNRISFDRNGVVVTASYTASVSVSSAANAQAAMTQIDASLQQVSTKRSTFGVMMNRMSTAVSNLQTTRLNISAANSRIVDVDVAAETATMSKNQVLTQAGAAVLAQANQTPQTALSLLR